MASRHRKSTARPSMQQFQRTSPGELFMSLLTFDKLMTGPLIHLIYWAGLALIVLGGFSVVGGAVGVATREPGIMKIFLALAVGIGGLLFLTAGALIWRSFCEVYVSIFRMGEDLHAIRGAFERGGAAPAEPQAPAPAPAPAYRPDGGDDLVSKI
ncbi:MAG TPA: DUF4282 domain-containing protein [Caulobacteraceae bacterium]|jgi:energy-converting hydrogenase Eha subunit E